MCRMLFKFCFRLKQCSGVVVCAAYEGGIELAEVSIVQAIVMFRTG